MLAHVRQLTLISLELPYRILRLCGGDMGFTSALTYDFEVYSAAQQKWLEVSSVSNFESFQTNRMRSASKTKKGKTQLLHSLNGSSLALPKVVACLLEKQPVRRRYPFAQSIACLFWKQGHPVKSVNLFTQQDKSLIFSTEKNKHKHEKKYSLYFALTVLVWAVPENELRPRQNLPAAPNTGSAINNTKPAETNTGSASVTWLPEIQAPEGTKTAGTSKEKSPEEQAAIAGQATFNTKCGKCHGLKPAQDYTAVRWVIYWR